MRDYLAAINERVVVFDGGMGATLEQFDLTSEDYGGLAGKCHEALILNRPDVIEGVHTSMVEAGAEVVETDTFQASRLKLEEWGLAEHTLEINRRAGEMLAAGVSAQEIRPEIGQVAEALDSLPLLAEALKAAHVRAPAIAALAEVVAGQSDAASFAESIIEPRRVVGARVV